MSFQPLAGISWGVSAPRPRSSLATSSGLVACSAGAPPPAAEPNPGEPSDPPAQVPRPSLVLAPPAVLRPTITAVASMPAHTVDLAIRRVSPGRFLGLLATLAIQALPNSSGLGPRLPPLGPTEPGRLGCWPASGPTAAQDLLTQPPCLTGVSKVQTAAAARPSSLRRCAVRLPGGPGSDAGRRRTVGATT